MGTFTYSFKVSAPTASPGPGSYSNTQSVTLSCATAGATIRYTTNGTAPTTTSPVYSGPITVSATTTIKAQAFKSGYANSDVGTFTYTVASQYTITYDANGGSGAPDNQTKIKDTNLPLSQKKPTKLGFVFEGWSTSSTATTATYKAGDIYTANASLYLYAVWTAQGGTWTPDIIPMTSGIFKKVYMPKSIAQEYYNVVSDEDLLKYAARLGAELGISLAVPALAAYVGISPVAAGAVMGVVIIGYEVNSAAQKKELLDKVRNCPDNGFVVIEYWRVKQLTGNQILIVIQHSNATSVDPGGSFKAGVYYTD